MKIENKIKDCNLCGNLPKLIEPSIQFGNTPFIIIGESPAKDGWIQSKKAFYNSSGKLQGTGRVLNNLLKNIDYSISDIYFTECCKCVIENRKMLNQCSSNCLPILFQQLKLIPCRIIVTMGLIPTQSLLQTKIKKFADVVGNIFELEINSTNYILLPIYHPSPPNPRGYKDNIAVFDKLKNLVSVRNIWGN